MNSNVGRGWIPHHHSRILPDRCWSLLVCNRPQFGWHLIGTNRWYLPKVERSVGSTGRSQGPTESREVAETTVTSACHCFERVFQRLSSTLPRPTPAGWWLSPSMTQQLKPCYLSTSPVRYPDGSLTDTCGGVFCTSRAGSCSHITRDFEARETSCVGMLECGEAKGCRLQIAMKQKLSGAQYRYVEDEIPNWVKLSKCHDGCHVCPQMRCHLAWFQPNRNHMSANTAQITFVLGM